MNFSSLTINNRDYSTSSSLEEDLNFAPQKNYLFDLSYLSIISVENDKARDFLQGQLSCDLRQVNSTTMRQGVMCNLKGRVLALMDVIDWQGLKLVLPADLNDATQSSLIKVAMLSRVSLKTQSEYQVYGFFLANPQDLLPTDLALPEEILGLSSTAKSCCYRLSEQLFLIIVAKEEANILTEPFLAKQQLRGSLAWHLLQLKRKAIEIYPLTRGLFLPHRLDLHLAGYLSFDKGCYKGQEIVARTHYRAKLKHGLELFTIETDAALPAGTKLFADTQGTEVGEVIDSSPLGNNRYLIAVSIIFEAPKRVFVEGSEQELILT